MGVHALKIAETLVSPDVTMNFSVAATKTFSCCNKYCDSVRDAESSVSSNLLNLSVFAVPVVRYAKTPVTN